MRQAQGCDARVLASACGSRCSKEGRSSDRRNIRDGGSVQRSDAARPGRKVRDADLRPDTASMEFIEIPAPQSECTLDDLARPPRADSLPHHACSTCPFLNRLAREFLVRLGTTSDSHARRQAAAAAATSVSSALHTSACARACSRQWSMRMACCGLSSGST